MSAARALDLSFLLLGLSLPLSLACVNGALGAATLALLWALASPDSRDETISRLRGAARSPLFSALLVYAAAGLAAGLAGLDPARSAALWPKDLHKVWVVLLAGAAVDARSRPGFARALAAGAAIAALAGIAQTLGAAAAYAANSDSYVREFAKSMLRARGFMHPVSYGETLGLAFLGVLIAGEEFLARRPRRVAAALLLAGLLLNQTRTVFAAVLAGVAVAAAAAPRWRRAAAAALLVVLAGLAAWEAVPNGRGLRRLVREGLHGPQAARATLWRVGLQIFSDHPATGVGPGQYRSVFNDYFDGVLDNQRSWGSAHNLFIHQAAERGLAGLAALVGVCAAVALLVRRSWTARPDGWALWALAASASFLVMNLTETAFQTEQVATMFLAVLAAATARSPAG